MATAISAISLVAVGISVFLVFLRPQWVFYLLIASAVFGNVLGGYVYAAGNLGLPRAWQPADGLAWLTLVATLLVGRSPAPRTGLHTCFGVIALMGAVSLITGMLFHPTTALTYSRALHFVPAMLFAARYLTTATRVDAFLKFATGLVLLMFVFHLLIRFGWYTPPVSEEEAAGQLMGERGERSLVTGGYLVLLAIGVARLAQRRGVILTSIILVLVSVAGVALTETRALYAVTLATGMMAFVFMRGRIKTGFVFGVAVLLALAGAAQVGFDVTSRFRARFGKGEIVSPFSEGPGWRTLEYGILARTFVQEPLFALTGRGIGALHNVPLLRVHSAGEVGYYHSEYLSWIDRTGLIGFVTYVAMVSLCLARSYRLARSVAPPLSFYATAVFLLVASLVLYGLFWQTYMSPRGAPLYVCFLAIVANWRAIQFGAAQPPTLPRGGWPDPSYGALGPAFTR